MREVHLAGLEYLDAATTLLQRIRLAHPTAGTYEAAELQFWWNRRRSTDDLDQLFWLDDDGRPVAAVLFVDFGDGSSLVYADPIMVVLTMPDPPDGWVAQVVERGLAHAKAARIESVEVEVDQADTVLRDLLVRHGFIVKDDGVVVCWMRAGDRADVSPLPDGYRLVSRVDLADAAHHLSSPDRSDVQERLSATSLYQPGLDLVVVDTEHNPAAWGMFWYDPVTSTGVVEPMRTADGHQRRGLGRHVLTAGVDRLAAIGAERISIGYEPGNPASGPLYRSVGFVPDHQTDLYAGSVGRAP